MEPITATMTTAKEIYEAAKTIQKVYNVSKEMKTVAESEGKDQIMATKDFADTAANLKQEAKNEKEESLSKKLKNEGNLYHHVNNEQHLPKEDFVDILEPTHVNEEHVIDRVTFVERLSIEDAPTKIIGDGVGEYSIGESANLNNPLGETEIIERNPERFSEKNQYVDSERIKEYRENPASEPLIEGYEKDADILRHNMETVMGEDAADIDKTNSRAHHIVGNNEYSGESQAILSKYGIDINSPENGIFLPNDKSSDLHGTIHEGKHTKAYNDEVTQRLRMARNKVDVLEILDSIKEDLYNGEMELYNNHKYNE